MPRRPRPPARLRTPPQCSLASPGRGIEAAGDVTCDNGPPHRLRPNGTGSAISALMGPSESRPIAIATSSATLAGGTRNGSGRFVDKTTQETVQSLAGAR